MEGWKEITLDNACLIKKGVQFNKTELEDSGSYPCINGGLQPSGYSEKWNTEADTITISEGGESCGYVNRISSRFWCGGHCYSLLQINEKINKDFFYFALKCRENSIMDLRVGSGLPNIQQKALKAFDFIYPISDIEQKKIAQILTALDDTIKQNEQLIAKYKNIKQGLMHDLLNYGIDENGTIRNPQTHTFVEKKGLMVPEEWEVVNVEDILELLTDFDANGSFADMKEFVNISDCEGYAWYVRATDLENNTPLNKVKYVDRQSYLFLRKSYLLGGEVLFAKRGEIGKVYKVPKLDIKMTLAPNTYLLRLNDKAISDFVYYYFTSKQGKQALIDNNASTTLGALYKDSVKAIKFPMPLKHEQRKIVSILEQQDKLIESEQTNLAKLQKLKQGLMADLLTGKVKVKTESV